MKGLLWLIIMLLIIGGAMWFYSKYFGAALDRTASAVAVDSRITKQNTVPEETTEAVDPKPASGSSRTGDSIRQTGIGKQINQIYSQHNKKVEDTTR